AKTDSGSVIFASLHSAWVKSDAAIGVTYSWEKRTSATANKASPGLTDSTPIVPAFTNACRAMIFSTMFIGRGVWLDPSADADGTDRAGGETSPASRALL